MPKIKAIIFDCYSTLIDIKTNEQKKEIFHYLSLYLQYYGVAINAGGLKSALDLERQQYLQHNEEPYPEIDIEIVFKNILKKQGLDNPFLVESCCKLFRVFSRERFQLFPDSLPVLEEMEKSEYSLAVVSDAQKVFCLDEGRIPGIDKYFKRIILSTQFGFRKPDPRLFQISCNLLNVLPEEAVYIGNDPETDIRGAKQIGMKGILLDRNLKIKNPEPKPDFRASDLWKAWEWIKMTG